MGDKKLGYQYYWCKDHNQHVALGIFADQPKHAANFEKFRWQLYFGSGEGISLLLIHSATVGSYPSDQMASLKFREN